MNSWLVKQSNTNYQQKDYASSICCKPEIGL